MTDRQDPDTGSMLASISTVLYENAKIRIEYLLKGDSIFFRPVGVIDEDVNLNFVLSSIINLSPRPKSAQVDLGSVCRINSCGVREWLAFVSGLQRIVAVSFVNVSEIFMEQAAVVRGTLGGQSGNNVLSLQIPLYCENCATRSIVLAQTAEIKTLAGEVELPQWHCQKCKKLLEFDGIPEQYFNSFLP